MKKIILFLLLFMLPIQARALTGKVLAIVCDQLGAAKNSYAYYADNTFYRCAEVQGWKYDVCMMSDSTFTKSLWPDGYVFAAGDTASGARYGHYDMAVMLAMPDPFYVNTAVKCGTYNMVHFDKWINRSHVRAFPIPLFVPMANAAMDATGVLAKAYTGALSVGSTFTSGKGQPYKDANGDSLYLYTANKAWALVAEADSTPDAGSTYPYSFSNPLMWRHTAGRASLNAKNAAMWMTVGTSNHRVIWLPNADTDFNLINWLNAFAMFTKVRPIEMPVIAYAFGATKAGVLEAGTDVVQYAEGFARNVEYAVANGIKLELLCYPYYMKTYFDTADPAKPDDVAAAIANNTTALAYAAAYPDNVRLTISSAYGWGPYAEDLSLIGSAGTYSQKVKRIQQVQDSCAEYFPTIDTDRLDIYAGRFIDPTYGRVDSALYALADRDIADVYCHGTAGYSQYPGSSTYGILGAQRTWVNDAGTLKEMRFHPIGYTYMRYDMQQHNNPDWLKTAYVDTVGTATTSSSVRRAAVNAKLLPYFIGQYTYIDGSTTSNRNATVAVANKANVNADYQVGMFLPALTFSGGSKLSWKNADHTADVSARRAQVDSTRSVFLDTMKQMDAMKKMGDYLVDTYGTSGSEPFKWSWLSDVLWDRRNGRPYPNSHIKME